MSLLHKITTAVLTLSVIGVISSCGPRYSYQTVEGDPLSARIYTLDNGLKVYMTVNKETPRIQTYVAVRVGGKDDPSETTGLAHYFEHLMFKGTSKFGTQNYELEKPLLDQIEVLFEEYRATRDEEQRKAIYSRIDSISLEASRYSIPNEYDKLMSAIGATGTNAGTSYDQTVYIEDIPSNQIRNWAKIQAARFSDNVIRGFHTELETVYEEMNMYSTMDSEKVIEKLFTALFPSHPYGRQTIIGTQEHLKNPSITNIKNYYATYYVPNNTAICLSGDFDPDEMIAVIDEYFGSWKPNPDLPERIVTQEESVQGPLSVEVWGLESENVTVGWQGPHVASSEDALFTVLGEVLSNGRAGIMDLDLNQQQKVLQAGAFAYMLADRSTLVLQGNPRQGQSLDQVKDLMLESLDKIRKGEFDESLLKAIVNNYKFNMMRRLESNRGRANMFVSSFTNGIPWEQQIRFIDRMEAVTKDDLVAFANKYFRDDNYAVIYKRQGPDTTYKKIEKPQITPIYTNRDTSSAFLQEILASEVKPIDPVFVDFEKDFMKTTLREGVNMIYVPNKLNDLFTLSIVYEVGSINDKALPVAFDYLGYLGTSGKTAEEISKAFYQLACSFNFYVSQNTCTITLNGLSENMQPALELLSELFTDAQPDAEVYRALTANILKGRSDAKADQRTNFQRLQSYVQFGPVNPMTHIMSGTELKRTDSATLIAKVRDLLKYQTDVYYYGPLAIEQAGELFTSSYPVAENLIPAPEKEFFKPQITTENKVYLAQYDANQMYYASYSARDNETYDNVPYAVARMYNEYFGSSMNAIVFQEMREARGLAYSANARYSEPARKQTGFPYCFNSFIATQNDKMTEALEAFRDIINNMPESEKSFFLAKEGLISTLRTERITGRNLLNYYRQAKDKDLWTDMRQVLFEGVQSLTLADVVEFQREWIANRPASYCILSDINALNLNFLARYGKVIKLSPEELFGY
ncbi:MAG: insulinase family protein [Bacteroidales bacterium]|jgi:predicted Zn-dependent peptidase|nr:insulinase family protein [Bacteroidales bacterium]MDD2264040.1 insulinase family protein [Bacteroidales bacterium]MDD2831274.1 insulinase family protein [Bacteroidales bacterium]MDD3208613.1 insulinase family protein [Bacteroidales bacterium]MDD3697176.1 insulinase family protein [Bacteroidales bacterium]